MYIWQSWINESLLPVSRNKITDDLISKLAFEEETPDVKKELLADVIKSYDCKLIEKFLMFVSGMRNFFTLYRDRKIKVRFCDEESIFSKISLTIPSSIKTVSILKTALDCVMDSKISFNTYCFLVIF